MIDYKGGKRQLLFEHFAFIICITTAKILDENDCAVRAHESHRFRKQCSRGQSDTAGSCFFFFSNNHIAVIQWDSPRLANRSRTPVGNPIIARKGKSRARFTGNVHHFIKTSSGPDALFFFVESVHARFLSISISKFLLVSALPGPWFHSLCGV